jgi:glycerol uptake facilitator-like aquaporin
MNLYFLEFIGTLFFIFVGLYTKNSLATGAALAAVIMLGGGEYNPTMTIVNLMSGKHALNETIPIVLAQLAGGLTALKLYKRGT